MVLARGIVALLAGLIAALFGVATPAAALTWESTDAAYTYGGHQVAEEFNGASAERGPPLAYDRGAAVDLRSHGASARPSGPTTCAAYAYDGLARLVQSARGGHDAEERVGGPTVGLVDVERSHVAANSVRPAVTDARLGRALADDFRGGPNPIGDGSALDAARHTVNTGELVGGSTHLEKAVEMRDRYARILRRGGLNSADQGVARGRYDAYSSFVIENDLDAMMRARGLR